jgi:hypothetical protein
MSTMKRPRIALLFKKKQNLLLNISFLSKNHENVTRLGGKRRRSGRRQSELRA